MKQFIFKVTYDEESGMTMESTNDGFNALEIVGMLSFKIEDIRKQLEGLMQPDIIKRNLIED